MMDLDGNIARIAAARVPDLSAIDGSALADRARAEARQSHGVLGLALVAALAIGIIGGIQVPTQVEAPLAAFGPAPVLTPLIALGQQ